MSEILQKWWIFIILINFGLIFPIFYLFKELECLYRLHITNWTHGLHSWNEFSSIEGNTRGLYTIVASWYTIPEILLIFTISASFPHFFKNLSSENAKVRYKYIWGHLWNNILAGIPYLGWLRAILWTFVLLTVILAYFLRLNFVYR